MARGEEVVVIVARDASRAMPVASVSGTVRPSRLGCGFVLRLEPMWE